MTVQYDIQKDAGCSGMVGSSEQLGTISGRFFFFSALQLPESVCLCLSRMHTVLISKMVVSGNGTLRKQYDQESKDISNDADCHVEEIPES